MSKEVTETGSKMGRHSPCVPCSVLFLLLLLLLLMWLSRAQSFQDPGSGWRASHSYYPNSTHFCSYGDPQARQSGNQDEDVLQYCDGAFDVYYLLDSSQPMLTWATLSSCLEDLAEKYVNPNLRMSFIVFNTRSRVEMMLTSNRTTIFHHLVQLETIPTGGEIYLQKALRQANDQIARANSRGNRVSSMIIALLTGQLKPDVLNKSVVEAHKARTMGAYIYCIGVSEYNVEQLTAIADSPEHVFGIHGVPRNLHGRVNYIGTRACLELRSVEPSPLCTDEHPIRMNMTTVICPKPQAVQPGQNITVEVSLNNGRDFLARSIRVKATADCNRPPTTTTRHPRLRPPSPMALTSKSMTPAPVTPRSLDIAVSQTSPPQKPRAKKPACPPPPPPLASPPPLTPVPAPPPVTVCPTIVVCCCACRGMCVNTGPEGSCTNFDLLEALCAQGPLAPLISLQPSQDSLHVAYCSQCHPPRSPECQTPF